MSDTELRTDGNDGIGTDPTPGTATQNNTSPAATDQPADAGQNDGNLPEGYELIKTQDKQNLISQRDKNHDSASKQGQDLEGVYGMLGNLAQREAIRDMQEKYPDVPKSILEQSDSYEGMESLAKEFQSQIKLAKQDALKDLQTVDGQPRLSENELATELKSLEGTGNLEKAISLKMFRRK